MNARVKELTKLDKENQVKIRELEDQVKVIRGDKS